MIWRLKLHRLTKTKPKPDLADARTMRGCAIRAALFRIGTSKIQPNFKAKVATKPVINMITALSSE